jgi:hypothetical protein
MHVGSGPMLAVRSSGSVLRPTCQTASCAMQLGCWERWCRRMPPDPRARRTATLEGAKPLRSRPLPKRQDQGDHAESHAGAEQSPPEGWRFHLMQGDSVVKHERAEYE